MAGEHIIKHNNGIIIDGNGDGNNPDTGIILQSYIFQYASGSTKVIEYSTSNTLQLRANTIITGSLSVGTGNTPDLSVTSAGVNIGNSLTDIHLVTGSLNITGSLLVNGSTPGGGSTVKAGSGSAASFGGTPRTASISFTTPFSNNNYSITVTGEDARSWTIQSKAAGSFVINSNSSVALTGPVYWIATPFANS